MKTVCVDFDGVLSDYRGWRGADQLDPPRAGAAAFTGALLSAGYEVVVLTTRDPDLVDAWCTEHAIPCTRVTATKPPAVVYLDDRAMLFEGQFEGLLERIQRFRAHWEP